MSEVTRKNAGLNDKKSVLACAASQVLSTSVSLGKVEFGNVPDRINSDIDEE